MRNLLNKAILILAVLAGGRAAAQDVHFSQFYDVSILRNPALLGIFSGDYKVGVVYRSQWSSISKPYQTAIASGEVRIPVFGDANDFVSIGLLAYYDKAGSIDLQTVGAYPAVTYNKSLHDASNSFLSVGFTGGYLQRSYDPTKATFNNQYQNGAFSQYNPTGEQLSNPKINMWDAGAGVSFSSTAGEDKSVNYFVGVGGYHFTQPKSSIDNNDLIKLDMKWTGSAGASIKLNGPFSVFAQGNYSKQGTYSEIIVGGTVGWNVMQDEKEKLFSINAGGFFRVGDALIPTFRFEYKDFTVGVSYDVNVSSLKAASNLRGGLEITLFKSGILHEPNFEKSRTLCPQFFD
jgi:type IX secretion system PorP/SprF family membrane protein